MRRAIAFAVLFGVLGLAAMLWLLGENVGSLGRIPASATAIGVGLLNIVVLQFLPAWKALGQRELDRGEQRQLAVSGGVSLLSWLTAVAAGRMIGYW